MKRKTEHFTYELIRAKRRSMSLKVDLDGTITVRAPYRTSVQTADWFVEGHRDWIEVRLRAGARIMAERPSYTDRERAEGRKQAAEVIKARCRYYAPVMGVLLRNGHDPGAEDPLGKLQHEGKPQFQLETGTDAAGDPGLCGGP